MILKSTLRKMKRDTTE